ncbi:MAG: LPS assembly protein LptD [Acidobacteriaceae bacterium]
MSTRACICIMLLAFCHVRIRAQALTMQLPPGRSGAAATENPSAQAALPDAPDAEVSLQDIPVAQLVPATPTGVPVVIRAREQEKKGDLYTLRGGVEIDYQDYVMLADDATYNRATGDIAAWGHLQLTGGPDHEEFSASHGTMNLDAQTEHLYDVIGSVSVPTTVHHSPSFTPGLNVVPTNSRGYTAPNPFLISGKEFIKYGPDRYALIQGSMTSCVLPRPDWQIFAPHILVDEGTAKAWNSNFRLLGYPILYLPYVTHAVNATGRQSGFLIPELETGSGIKGTVIGDQYYWAINRSADLTVGAQYYSLRGWEQNAEFRFKGRGNDFAHGLYDGLEDRGLAPLYVNQGGQDTLIMARRDITPYLRAVTHSEYLSSYVFRQVFAENFSVAVSSEVKSWAFITHEKNGFAGSFDLERYQNYASDTSGDEIRLLHLPRLEFDAADHSLGRSGVLASGEASFGFLSRSEPQYRSHNVGRMDAFPHISMPWIADGWSFRPTIGLRETLYSHSQDLGPVPPDAPPPPTGLTGSFAAQGGPVTRDASLNRKAVEADIQILPPVLERDFSGPFLAKRFGVELRHTIAPEVNYRYVAGIDKFNQVPRFDATDIFSDTNEVEYGVTQRLFIKRLHPEPCPAAVPGGPPLPADCGEVSRQWLSWFVGQKYFADPTFGGAVIPGRRNIFTTTLDFSGVSYITAPRSVSPIVSRLRVNASTNTDLEWDFDYDTKAGRVAGSDVFADYRHGNFFSGIGHSLLNAVGETPLPANQPANFVNYDQMQLLVGYGGMNRPGLSAAAKSNLDLNGRSLEYLGMQATYNFNCCGFTVEVQHYALGTVRDETTETFSITLSGVTAAGNLVRAERLF